MGVHACVYVYAVSVCTISVWTLFCLFKKNSPIFFHESYDSADSVMSLADTFSRVDPAQSLPPYSGTGEHSFPTRISSPGSR